MGSDKLDLKAFVSNAPHAPGVYQFFSDQGDILYIGKAKDLQNRLRNYQQNTQDLKTQVLVSKIANCVLTIAHSEQEALLLEQKLIRQHKPPYNILLKDDKSYPYVVLTKHSFPRIKTYRGTLDSQDIKYAFGPYPSADLAKQTLEILIDIFKLRTCSDHTFISRTRPCLQYQIQRCSAPCVNYINKEDYLDSVAKVRKFLNSSSSYVIDFLVSKMDDYSDQEQFEKAALVCKHIKQLRSIQRSAGEVGLETKRVDVIDYQWPYLHHIMIANGDITSSAFHTMTTQGQYSDLELLSSVLNYIYSPLDNCWLPDKIIVDKNRELSKVSVMGKDISLTAPNAEIEQLWLQTAQQSLWQNIHQKKNKSQFFKLKFQALENDLGISPIESIECLDISHLSGEHTLGAIVHMTPEGFQKSFYRRYNIKHDKSSLNDDYHSIYQTTVRHLTKSLKNNTLPSLLLIDGGKGQLSSAHKALDELGLDIPLLAMAKGDKRRFGEETIFKLDRDQDVFQSLSLNKLDKSFHLLGQVRDEAHRFAITAVRKKAGKKMQASPLDDLKGIGQQKKKSLLNHFGGWQGLKDATLTQLEQVSGIGPKMAKMIYDFLQKN